MPESSTDDLDLLARANLCEEAAFRLLYERHRLAVYRFAYRLLGDVPAAEDVTHDCFLSLIRRPQSFDASRASLRTYLYGAARHLAMKRLRRHESETAIEDLACEPRAVGDQSEPLESLLNNELSLIVQKAVASLPLQQREVIVLFEFEEVPLAEIALIVDADVNAVKSRLWRARQRLRTLLAPYVEESRIAELAVAEGHKHAR